MSVLRFWAMTVGMTVLIWFAADQSVTTSMDVRVPIDFRSAVVDSMVITVDEASRGSVELEFRGPNRSIGAFREIKDTLRPRIEIADRDSGKYQLDLVEELRKNMNQFQSMQMEFQRTFSDAMAQQLANFNIPSRDEILKIGETLTVIDRRLLQIEKALAKINDTAAPTPTKKKGPARTRKPPSADAKEA